ncbi:hypothetical protein [Nocardia aobensis]|uniref:hypothetical protein n=1 Tax=Nocardia aobensis TaxID=257277 RepID=UPI0012F662DD|nr:hypothetical protein [Nocardia aobensis]
MKATVALVVSASVAACGFGVAALNRQLHWGIEWGPLGSWMSAFLSAVAVSVALWVALENDSERKRERREKKERAARRARRIHFSVAAAGEDGFIWRLNVRNHDDRPIYDLRFEPGWVVDWPNQAAYADVKVNFQPPTRMIAAGGEWRSDVLNVTVRHLPIANLNGTLYLPAATFEDDDGYVFCWHNDPIETIVAQGRITGTWILQDECGAYPADQPAFTTARRLRENSRPSGSATKQEADGHLERSGPFRFDGQVDDSELQGDSSSRLSALNALYSVAAQREFAVQAGTVAVYTVAFAFAGGMIAAVAGHPDIFRGSRVAVTNLGAAAPGCGPRQNS